MSLSTAIYAFDQTAKTTQTVDSNGTLDIVILVPSLKLNTSSIQWGTLYPNINVTRNISITNDGNTTIKLSMYGANWNPVSTETYLTLGWNRQNYMLQPNQTVTATVWLYVAPNPPITGKTDFSVNIYVDGDV